VFADDCVTNFISGRLGPVNAATAKYWLTECRERVVDGCLQLYGEDGFLQDHNISRLWADGRVERIYGGTNEIMKEMIATSL
jgi:acyl-CoA dehydrogenase